MESYGKLIQEAEKRNNSSRILYDENYTTDNDCDTVIFDSHKKKYYTEDTESEVVNHPSHYNTGKIEVIDFIEDQKLGFHLGNAVKYICRAGKKDPAKVKEDLEKAIWYINRYIKRMEDKE